MNGQKKKHSLLEAVISTGIGFVVAFTANIFVIPLVLDVHLKPETNFILTCVFTVISVIRQYGVRRLFNWMHKEGILR